MGPYITYYGPHCQPTPASTDELIVATESRQSHHQHAATWTPAATIADCVVEIDWPGIDISSRARRALDPASVLHKVNARRSAASLPYVRTSTGRRAVADARALAPFQLICLAETRRSTSGPQLVPPSKLRSHRRTRRGDARKSSTITSNA